MDSEFINKRICCNCIAETYLQRVIRTTGQAYRCSYCDNFGPTLSLGNISERIHKVIETYFVRTPVDPEYYHPDGYDRPGDIINILISDLLSTGEEIAEEIREYLYSKYSDYDYTYTEENDYDQDAQYAERELDISPLNTDWNNIIMLLKEKGRKDAKRINTILDNIFVDITDIQTFKKESVITEIDPEREDKYLFRARVFTNPDKLIKALEHPDTELGTPQKEFAKSGRMNKKGVSVFYGAFDADTAISEVRPPVGSNVSVAKFLVVRKLRLLELNKIERAAAHGSYFDENEKNKRIRVGFLRKFCELITIPVMPGDERSEYLITQVVANYLDKKIGLDGIIFPSVQTGRKESQNIVLFNKSAAVEKMFIPDGTKIETRLFYADIEEDIYEPYFVHESRPKSAVLDIIMEPNPKAGLRILLNEITIYKIKGAKYRHCEETVHRTISHPYEFEHIFLTPP